LRQLVAELEKHFGYEFSYNEFPQGVGVIPKELEYAKDSMPYYVPITDLCSAIAAKKVIDLNWFEQEMRA